MTPTRQPREITFDFSNPALYNPVYLQTWNLKHRFLHLFGSAGSGKSVFAVQRELAFSFLSYRKNRKTLVARRFYNSLGDSVFSELNNQIFEWDLQDCFHSTKSPYAITNTVTGVRFIFIGLDNLEKVKSVQGVDRGLIEEATEMRSKSDLDQLGLRARGFKDVQWTLCYNPINVNHWLNTEIHQKRPASHFIFKTTYKDNIKLLAKHPDYGQYIESFKHTNPNYYRIYGLGEWGQEVEGLIFPNTRSVAEMPIPQAYGLDTGWNDQTALVKVTIEDEWGKDKKQLYAQELIYESKLNIEPFMARVRDLKLSKRIPIVYDPAHAGKLFADALAADGYWVEAADKSEGSVQRGIKTINELDFNIVAGSKNMFKEVQNYIWAQKNGTWLDKPADNQPDHLMDATRYASVHISNPRSSGSEHDDTWY